MTPEEAQAKAAEWAAGGAGGAGVGGGGEGGTTACPDHEALGSDLCWWYAVGPWVVDGSCCYTLTEGSCCGRPFLVGGEARRAPVVARADWFAPAAPTERLDDHTRSVLADAWLADARLEHASIAAFARFTLQLLAFGAPADLIAASQQASLDELDHARACFALASRYAGSALGPGQLAIDGATTDTTLSGAAVTAVLEGCVGETVAALLAVEQLRRAGDPEVHAALERIARDEARHAELAWRFVRWALERGGASVREAVVAAFAAARDDDETVSSARRPVDTVALHRHGRLTKTEAADVRRRAIREVVKPCALALLGPMAFDSSLSHAQRS